LVAIETGALIAIFHQVKIAMSEKIDQTRDAIDNYLIKRFDYEIEDYPGPTTKVVTIE